MNYNMKRLSSGSEALTPSKKRITQTNIDVKQNAKSEEKPKFGKKTMPVSHKNKTPRHKFSKQGVNSKFEKKLGFKIGNKKKVLMMKNKGKKSPGDFPDKLLGKDGKPIWNKVKEEKKKLKEVRKTQRTGEQQYQLSVKAKSIWEKLRRKGHTAEKKKELVNDLFMLLKGQIPNVVHSHDMARVVQWMLKLGSPSVRTAICEELCANTVSCLQSKYASYCVRRALRYGSKADRDHLIQSCKGHFLKLIGHTFAAPIVEMMYSMFAAAEQRRQMHKELYGEMHALVPPEVSTIANIPDNVRPAILAATKANLTKLLDKKELLKSTLVQSVLNDFLSSCSHQDRLDILELIHGDILELVTTKEGARVALLAIWHGTNKIKKVIVKSMKGRVKEIATSEVAHMFLMALFDSIDDTVLVKKALIPELLNEAEELVKDELGRKIILYLVAHRDPAYFHPQQIEILSRGDAISSRKKDATVRKEEMLEAVSAPLLQKIADDPTTWFEDASTTMVSLAILKSGKGEALRAAFEKMVTYILDPSSMVEVNNRQFHVVEDSAMHLAFKKLIQQDTTNPDRASESFSLMLASRLTEENLNHILQFNRGCFLLVLLIETNNQEVCKIIKSKITDSMKKFLRKQETTGSTILLKKLTKEK